MSCVYRMRFARRRGLSILEVLVSIGILTLGLLGVIALIPIAAQHLRRGMALDDATATARAGLADFQARDAANIQRWLRYRADTAPTPPTPAGTLVNLWGVQFSNPTNAATYVDPSWSFCIDPLMYESVSVLPSPNRNQTFFPYQPRVGAGFPTPAQLNLAPDLGLPGRMIRVTLNWNPINWRFRADAFPSLPTDPTVFRTGLAETMCVSQDDLLFYTPGEEPVEGLYSLSVADDDAPSEQYDISMRLWDDPTAPRVKRNYRGAISWFATLVPQPGAVSGAGRYYTLSVAVAEGRDLVIDQSRQAGLDSTTESLQNVEGERACGIRFVGDGFGGGEVELVSYLPNVAAGLKDLSRLREGNWILVSGPSNGTGHLYYWYRIGTIETEPVVVGGQAIRRATLRGPDWPGSFYPSTGMAEAIIVANVINVFEQTIELRGE